MHSTDFILSLPIVHCFQIERTTAIATGMFSARNDVIPDDVGSAGWKTHAVALGANPHGVWRLLSPEDEAKCYINVQILTLSREKFLI